MENRMKRRSVDSSTSLIQYQDLSDQHVHRPVLLSSASFFLGWIWPIGKASNRSASYGFAPSHDDKACAGSILGPRRGKNLPARSRWPERDWRRTGQFGEKN